jgi:predicted dehydrogenase
VNDLSHFNRRRLLLGTLGASLLAQTKPADEVRMPQKIRMAIAGFDGHVNEILRVMTQLPDVELVAVADAGSDSEATRSALEAAPVARAHRYARLSELLDHESLDLVALCNNNGDRASAILACASRNLNVIAEKPLALNRSDLDAVYKAAKANGIHLGMLLPMRFDPPYLAMKRIVEDGTIGEVLQVDGQKSYQLGNRPAWQKHAATYGSTILWIAIHTIDLMLWVGGRRFTEVSSLQSRVGFPEIGDMQNVTASLFRLDNGGTATLHMDYLRPRTASGHGDDRLRVVGSRGIVEYQESTGVTLMTHRQAPQTIRDLPAQQSVFLDYLQSVYLNGRPHLSWPEIVMANEVTLAAHTAAELHRSISIANG